MKCTECNKDKSNECFSKCKSSKTGYQFKCKECKKIYYNINKNEILKKCNGYYYKNIDIIKQKSKENYNKDKQKYKNRNKKYSESDKGKKKLKEYYDINKDRRNEYVKNNNKNRYKTDLEYNKYIKNKAKEWEQNNKPKKNERQKNRYKTDISFRLKLLLRNRLNQALCGNMKLTTTLKLLGCSIEEFKQRLEQQFKPEMTWENHGEIWEIDHIKPCISFDLTDIKQQQECFHYTNLQPLFKTTEIAISFGYINEIGNRDKSVN